MTAHKTEPHGASRGQSKGYVLVAIIYLLGLVMGALDMSIVNPARTVIQNDMGVDDALGVWVITIYTLAYAASIPVMGKLADRHGRKQIYLLCIFLFGAGSALCGVAECFDSFELLLGARVIQALGGGGIMPVATAEFGTAFPEEKRGMALGMVGMVYGMGSIFGPMIGSLILDIFGQNQWQFIFYVNIPICLAVLLMGIKKLPTTASENVKPIDGIGILLLTAMTLGLMYGLKNIDFFDLGASIASSDVWPCLLAFVVLLPLFVLRETRAQDPVINLGYFRNINVIITLTCAVLSGVLMMGTLFFPQFCENALAMKSGSGGYLIALLGLGSGVGSMLSGKLIDKHGVKPVLGAGFVGSAIGSAFMAFVACNNPNLVTVCGTLLLSGLGLGFTMGTPLNYMMLQNTEERESNSSLATLSLIRSVGTAVAPAIMVAFIVHASAGLQGTLMTNMPKDVSATPPPHAQELDEHFESLSANKATAQLMEELDMPKLASFESATLGKEGAPHLSDKAIDEMQNSDVTTIVGACRTMSSELIDQQQTQLTDKVDAGIKGINQAIKANEQKITELGQQGVKTNERKQLESTNEELGATVSKLEDVRGALPATFDTAKTNYLAALDKSSGEIQASYQQTLNGGFHDMALFV